MTKLTINAEFSQIRKPNGLRWREVISMTFHLNQLDLLFLSVPDNQIGKPLVKAFVVVQ